MSGFQRYLFRNVLRTLMAIVGGLALIAVLTQGLNPDQLNLIVENRQSIGIYFWVTLLAVPQIISLLMPIALFIAAAAALNVAHRENEIVIAQASGMSNWQVSSPVMRLAVLAAILHLGLNLWVQPAASRELRETVSAASTDLAASLVREGAFMTHGDGLTTFARKVTGGEMRDLMINDSRNPKETVTYFAKTAYLVQGETGPQLVMQNGQRQSLRDNGSLEQATFAQGPFDLSPFINDQKAVVMEESDRYLPELFFPDMNNYYDYDNVDLLLAEGHARISAPLLNIAMAMLAIYAVLGGDFSRRGYAKRIAAAAGAALVLRLAAFGAVAAGRDDPSLNVLQYLIPVLVIIAISFFYFIVPILKRRALARRNPSLAMAGAA
ncbi:MAG TPA: LptF/LptG family permease [Hyphomonadaceae bacterium]|nr:LptF/LptG family permease [Hyphomonadaceae bacterium]